MRAPAAGQKAEEAPPRRVGPSPGRAPAQLDLSRSGEVRGVGKIVLDNLSHLVLNVAHPARQRGALMRRRDVGRHR